MTKPIRKSRVLHLSTLIDHGACADQVELFKKTYGTATRVTVAKCVAVAHLFDFDWARCLLGPTARAEYDKARASAWAEYEKACASAWAEYEKARAAAWAEYGKAIAPAWAAAYINDKEK